jgi:hypothetical protein
MTSKPACRKRPRGQAVPVDVAERDSEELDLFRVPAD